ncbi:putative methyltransferase YcgJ [bacterium BMS3Bbin02]|nr:putative methyltransferase YcgJ [bacterium BMS3Bbin02]
MYDPIMAVIPFYGSEQPDLFEIERHAMDREGLVIAALDTRLPVAGRVLDVGAGDGYTAERLRTQARGVVPLEPSRAMIRTDRHLPWIQGDAELLPFVDGSFDAAYATWAYFFSRDWDPSPGILELHRVVRSGGPLLIVENLGPDEFSGLAPREINADPGYWKQHGFECHPIDTHFEFTTITEARSLLEFFFGDQGAQGAAQRLTFRVGLFCGHSSG